MDSTLRYLTTPIYYVNDVPHLGHAYTSIIADTMARFFRLQGHETLLLTGTDEHGQKIERAAHERGFTPKAYADDISTKFRELWDEFEISYDIYARTTDARHIAAVQDIFAQMFAKGDIYKGEYEGYYCISCETFFTKTQLVGDCRCPDCGKSTELLREESYFFRLSKYQGDILRWYESADPILPRNKKAELVNFVSSGLKDLSITRTSFDWGIKLPESLHEPKHIIYVWLDALFIYLSSLDYISKGRNLRFFPAHMHIVGKDILKFHAVYFPAFLMSVGLKLPKYVAAHGWWTREGEKMSKSKGNVVKPKEVADAYGLEAFRYFLLREVPFGNDGDFSENALIKRINTELCNELGNLLSRIVGMSAKYSASNIDSAGVSEFFADELAQSKKYLNNAVEFLEQVATNRYLDELFKALSVANSSISKYEPWNLVKNGDLRKANALVALCANILAKVAVLLSPALPHSAAKIAETLGFEISPKTYQNFALNDNLLNFKCKPTEALFSKVEKPLLSVNLATNLAENSAEISAEKRIKIDDFKKIEIKIATVKACERVEGSEKLLKFQLEIGSEMRQVISGIAKYYAPQDLVGRQVCVLTNLKKAKIFGLDSDGMILSASDGDKLVLLTPESLINSGATVS